MGAQATRGGRERTRRRGGVRGLVRGGLAVCATVALVAGCEDATDGAGGAPAPAADGHAVSPLHNPDGTRPGLAPVTSEADQAAARRLIARVATKGRGPKTGYERDEFGYAWMDTADGVPLARNGCDTRNVM